VVARTREFRTGVALARIITATALVIGFAGGIPPAGAHAALNSCDPPVDAALSAGPERVSATFNEELQSAFAVMTLIGPDGNLWSTGNPEVRGNMVGIAVRPLGPSGSYTANYRVTSADGHVVSGSWSFTVTTPGPGTPGPAVAETAGNQRIPLWPFIVGATTLIAGMTAWALWRRP